MLKVRLDRDVEKAHGISFVIGGKKGINFSLQWRSWEADDRGHDPWMLSFNVFVYGTFLGARPFSDTWLGRRCASNGVTLFHWTAIRPKEA